eukprot:scaffold56948_cov61-Phaeocystis_antarctica.AAC.2
MEPSVLGCRLPRVSRDTSNTSRHSGSASPVLPPRPRARPGAVHPEARCSARHGTRPCTDRSGRPRPPSGPCAASARGSVREPTWRCRGRRTAARAGRPARPPGTAGTAPPPPRGRACVGPNVCLKPS